MSTQPKVTTTSLKAKKRHGQKVTMLTAYDFPMASFIDPAGDDEGRARAASRPRGGAASQKTGRQDEEDERGRRSLHERGNSIAGRGAVRARRGNAL